MWHKANVTKDRMGQWKHYARTPPHPTSVIQASSGSKSRIKTNMSNVLLASALSGSIKPPAFAVSVYFLVNWVAVVHRWCLEFSPTKVQLKNKSQTLSQTLRYANYKENLLQMEIKVQVCMAYTILQTLSSFKLHPVLSVTHTLKVLYWSLV